MVRNIAGTAMALQPRTRQASVVSVERLKVYLTERQMSVRHRDDELSAASSRYQRRAEVQEVYLTERQMSVRHRVDELSAASSRYHRRAEEQEKPGWGWMDVECRGSAQLAHYLVGIDQGTQGSKSK